AGWRRAASRARESRPLLHAFQRREAAMNWVCLALLASAATTDYERANQLFQQGRFVEAKQALDRALAQDPNLVPALTLKGKLAMGLNRFDDAREAFSRAARLDPESPYTQFLLGFFYYVDNDFQKALAPLEQSAKLNPLYSRATFYLALTQEGL